MNDYLWDKTGEPDADTERLENLLGTLRQEPRALELPREPPSFDSRQAWWSPRLAAVAAALALAVLAGVIITVMRGRDAGGGDASSVVRMTREAAPSQTAVETAEAKRDEATGTLPRQATAQRATETSLQATDAKPRTTTAANAGSEAGVVSKVARRRRDAGVEAAREGRRERAQHASVSKRQQRLEANESNARAPRAGTASASLPTTRSGRRTVVPVAEADIAEADLAERQRAKAQLMLALRLTTDKLSFVQAKTNERTRPSGIVRPAPEEKNRIR